MEVPQWVRLFLRIEIEIKVDRKRILEFKDETWESRKYLLTSAEIKLSEINK